MSELFDTLQRDYQSLLARWETESHEEAFWEDVQAFIPRIREAGATIGDLNERSQLRAWMRFLAQALYDATGVMPDVTLQPLAQGRLESASPSPATPRARAPATSPLLWTLLGGAAIVIIVVGLLFINSPSLYVGEATPSFGGTPEAPVISAQAVVGSQLDATGSIEMPTDLFCFDTAEVIIQLTMDGVPPTATWRWEVQRDGQVVNASPKMVWGEDTGRITIRALGDASAPVEPGKYELLVYVEEHVVQVQTFRVLEKPPRIFNLQLSDTPDAPRQLPGQTTQKFDFVYGIRVVYLGYDYEGMCPGTEVAYVLLHEGEPLREIHQTWSDVSQGMGQVDFSASDDEPLPVGTYQVVVSVAGTEQARLDMSIRREDDATGGGQRGPVLANITIAQGVRPDGTPLLTRTDNRFDWNTRLVYAIFDYAGMTTGTKWMVIWARNGQEVKREEYTWVATSDDGVDQGRFWVVYYDENGRTLPGGDYTVTLYIDNVAQAQAEFHITYYVAAP